jgi:hypothetical protein
VSNAAVIQYFGWAQTLPLGAFFVFMASVALEVVLLSEQLRQKLQQLIERKTSMVDVKELCAIVVKMVSETGGSYCHDLALR